MSRRSAERGRRKRDYWRQVVEYVSPVAHVFAELSVQLATCLLAPHVVPDWHVHTGLPVVVTQQT